MTERGLHPAPAPFPPPDGRAGDRALLRDGLVVAIRRAGPSDVALVRQFFGALSPQSRRRRFLSSGEPPQQLVERLCQTVDPRQALTLLAFSHGLGGPRAIAVASYSAWDASTAEVAFAVDDGFQGRGLGTALLERLASAAVDVGLKWFQACTFQDNAAMLRVFRDSGFEIRSRTEHGVVDVRLDLTPPDSGLAAMEERHRIATVASLRPIFQPESVAIIGASRDPSSIGRQLFDALLEAGFAGPIYPINPAADTIDGHRCYRAIGDVPGGVDLAVVAVPAPIVPQVVRECGAAGVKGLVVVSAGFAETGHDGRWLQQQLRDIQLELGFRLVGPNCMGVLNARPEVRLNASLSPKLPPSGHIAVATQSGGLGLAILHLATDRKIGLSTFVSLGNKIDVSGNDLLEWAEGDAATSVILLYLESFGNPRRFGALARRVGQRKPIVILKSGRTFAGGRAAGSHTAGLSSNEAAVDALVRQSGLIRAETMNELFDVAECLVQQPLPPGPRLGIISNAGGPGILAADACEGTELRVEAFTTETQARLRAHLSPQASVINPVDLIASASAGEYRHAIETVLAAPETDALIAIYTPVDPTKDESVLRAIGDEVVAARAAGSHKPVVVCTMAHSTPPVSVPAGAETLPVFVFPEPAVRALGKACAYARWRLESTTGLYWSFDEIHADEARALCRHVAATRGDTWLTREELNRVLNAFGMPLAASGMAASADEAAALAAIIGFPVVLKVSSDQVLHKTEIGGVRLNLTTEEAVRRAYGELSALLPLSPAGAVGGVLVQPMICGVETFIGLTEDPVFGPLVAFGLGGINVEVVRDVSFRMAPLTDRDARELVREVRGFPLLQGHRRQPPADIDALRDTLLRVSIIGQRVPEVAELDLNPVIALPAGHGCRIVDARARVRPSAVATAVTQ